MLDTDYRRSLRNRIDYLEPTLDKMRHERTELIKDLKDLSKEKEVKTKELDIVINSLKVVKEHKVYDFTNVTDLVIEVACDIFKEAVNEVKSKSQRREMLEPRGCINLILREHKVTLYNIGQNYHGRNGKGLGHDSVLNSVNTHTNLVECDKEFKRKVDLTRIIVDRTLKENSDEQQGV